MPHKMNKSLLPTDEHVDAFQRLCNTHINEMRMHDAHMKRVTKDPKKYHPYPAPSAHPDILNSIVKDGDDYNIEFEIIEEKPVPLTFEEKKNKLVFELNKSFFDAQQSFMPPLLKQRLAAMEIGKIMIIEDAQRTPEQKKIMAEYQKKEKRLNELAFILAKAESEIHDLTEKNIDSWKLPIFEEPKK